MDRRLQCRRDMKLLRSQPHFERTALLLVILLIAVPCFAQSGLESRITETINAMVRIINILIIGFVVWSGFLIAKGEGSGFQKLMYSIVGLVVANGAYMIINYFS
jgi:hypothetical protein